MARSPMNQQTRAEARRLFEQGLGRNEIARELDVDPATITRWAKSEGLEFDRSAVKEANTARTIDLAKARIELAQEMAATGLELLRTRHGEYLVYAFGGKDNTYTEHTLDRPPVEVIRNIVTTAAIAFDKASKVVEGTPEGLSETVSVLDRLDEQLEAEFAGVEEPE